MTHFEYLAVAHTLIITFAVIRALSGFPTVAIGATRYWVHLSWLCMALVYCLLNFWLFWSFREIEWTLVGFITFLVTPAVLYVYCSILVPSDPSSVRSWRDHFFAVRIPLFATGLLFFVTITFGNFRSLGTLNHPVIFGDLTFLAIYIVGLSQSRPGIHSLLALIPPLLFAVFALTVFNQPDVLTRVAP